MNCEDSLTGTRPDRIGYAKHHLWVALVVASVLTLLHHGDMLNWLDAVMLRVVGAAGIPTVQDSAQPSRDMPVVLLLGDNLYERAFHQESPLDRTQLATLIDTIAGQCPSILAVDIDLSPGPADAPSNRWQSTLDRALLATLKPEVCQSSTALILSTPVPVNTSELVEQKFQWMKRVCEAGCTSRLPTCFCHRAP